MAQNIKKMMEKFEMECELLQPWSTFVMKTQLPPPVLEKMMKITDEIINNKESATRYGDRLAGQIEDEFLIEEEILEREDLMGFFLDVCRTYVVQAFCQSQPYNKQEILRESWITQMTKMYVVSQHDNEYNPIHVHSHGCHLSTVMYLKIPDYLPNRKLHKKQEDDGAITFTNNSSTDKIWGDPTLQIQPRVGDFFIFPATQSHQVYPFRTADGKGERRSVSFNAVFSSETEQNRLNTQTTGETDG
jgi:hypothetical protein